jgi:hypothetical protein
MAINARHAYRSMSSVALLSPCIFALIISIVTGILDQSFNGFLEHIASGQSVFLPSIPDIILAQVTLPGNIVFSIGIGTIFDIGFLINILLFLSGIPYHIHKNIVTASMPGANLYIVLFAGSNASQYREDDILISNCLEMAPQLEGQVLELTTRQELKHWLAVRRDQDRATWQIRPTSIAQGKCSTFIAANTANSKGDSSARARANRTWYPSTHGAGNRVLTSFFSSIRSFSARRREKPKIRRDVQPLLVFENFQHDEWRKGIA